MITTGRAPGDRIKIQELKALMAKDPIWSTKGLTDEQRVRLCDELAEKREREALSSRPSTLSAAKLSSERLKLVDHQVRAISDFLRYYI